MSLSEFRRRHLRWARFLMLRQRTARERMRGHAGGLMSLASLGMFATAPGVFVCYAVAGIVREGVRAADENPGFV